MITLFRPDTVFGLKEVKEAMVTYIRQLPAKIFPVGPAVQIFRYELNIEPINILYWLHNQKTDVKIYWSGRNGKTEMGGVGIADMIKGESAYEHQHLFTHMKDRLSADNPHLRYYGGLCFDPANIDDGWRKFGTYQFIIPRFEINRLDGQMVFAFNIALSDIVPETIKTAMETIAKLDFSAGTVYRTPPKVTARADQPDRKGWEEVFAKAERGIQDGQFDKIVIARKSVFDFDVSIRPNALMKHLKDLTPDCFHFCYQPCANTAFLGASPERLYKRVATHLESEAIAGTRPRGKLESEDIHLGKQLLRSKKDAEEHRHVVQVIGTSLEPICQTVTHEPKFRLHKLKESQHLITSFSAELKPEVGDEQILTALHPTPAVGGNPGRVSVNAIHAIEPFRRGWYAGPFGFVGHDCAEFAVAIRSGLIDQNHLSLFAGAGIVAGSAAENEWREIENKISSFISVFNK